MLSVRKTRPLRDWILAITLARSKRVVSATRAVMDVAKTRCFDTMDRMLEADLGGLESELGKAVC